MTTTTPPDPAERTEPPLFGDERATIEGFLDYQRATLAWKCSGLSGEQLASRPLPSTTLSLLGLVRHLTEVEQGWYRTILAGQDLPDPYSTADNRDGDLDDTDPARAEADLQAWRDEIVRCRESAAAYDLDATSVGKSRRGERFSLRWIHAHMLEEYARHNGHADLLREAIDGATGE